MAAKDKAFEFADDAKIEVIGDKYIEINVREDDPHIKNKFIPVTDGNLRAFTITLGTNIVVPIGVYNVLNSREITEEVSHYDSQNGTSWTTKHPHKRFIIDVIRPIVSSEEGKQWMANQKSGGV